MEEKKDKGVTILKIVAGILMVIMIGLVCYMLYDKNLNDNENVIVEQENSDDNGKHQYEDKLKDIDSSKLKDFEIDGRYIEKVNPSMKDFEENAMQSIKELLHLYKVLEPFERSLIIRSNDKVNSYKYNDILKYNKENPSSRKLLTATNEFILFNENYQKYLKQYVDDSIYTEVDIIPKKEYEKAYHELWGEDKKIPYELCGNMTDFGGTIEKDDYIIIDRGASGFEDPYHLRDRMNVDKYEINDDILTVYIKYLSVEEVDSDKYKIYKDVLQKELISENVTFEEVDDDELLKKYDNQRGTYKLTFKKSSNNKYCWESTIYLG